MLGPSEYAALAATLNSSESRDDWNESEIPGEYDVNMLDYTFVRSATSIRELKKVIAILRSGKEGYYPDLEKAAEDRVLALGGKLQQRATKPQVDTEQLKELSNDLGAWLQTANAKDQQLRLASSKITSSASFSGSTHAPTRPVYSNNIPITSNKISPPPSTTTYSKQRINSYDYRAWDKFDVEAEVERLEKEDTNQAKEAARINKDNGLKLPNHVRLSEDQVENVIEEDRIKGNEAFRCGDYDEALQYYTRAIDLKPQANLYTNRSLVYIKTRNYEAAEADATSAISLDDPEFMYKGYLRRGVARFKRGKYFDAINDFEQCKKLEPGREEVKAWLKDCENKWMGIDEIGFKRWKRKGMKTMKIVECSNDTEKKEIIIDRETAVNSSRASSQVLNSQGVGVNANGERNDDDSNLAAIGQDRGYTTDPKKKADAIRNNLKPKIQISEVETIVTGEYDPFGEETKDAAPAEDDSKEMVSDMVIKSLEESKTYASPSIDVISSHNDGTSPNPSPMNDITPIQPTALPLPMTSYDFESIFQKFLTNLNDRGWINYIYSIPVIQFARLVNNLSSVDPVSGIIIGLLGGVKGDDSLPTMKRCIEILQVVSKSKRIELALTFMSADNRKDIGELFNILEHAPAWGGNNGIKDVIRKLKGLFIK